MARAPVSLRTEGARLLGGDLIEQKLERLAAGVRLQIIQEGLGAMAEVIRASAARRAADHPALAAAFATKLTTTQAGRMVALVGVPPTKARGGIPFDTLLRWREFGTKAHEVVAGAFTRVRRSRRVGRGTEPSSTKRLLASPTAIFGRRARHPGTRPRPTLGAAFTQDGARALHVGGQTIWERLRTTAS